MHIKKITPVIAVKDITQSRAFYEENLGFQLVHQENDWYIHLMSSGGTQTEIGFVASHHPSQPEPFQTLYGGEGLFLTLTVTDVDDEYRRLKEKGIPILLETRDEPWGERHFAIKDPNGIILNISRTDAAARGEVSMTDHMIAKDKGVHAHA